MPKTSSTETMAVTDVEQRFQNVVATIMTSLNVSQMELGEKYLDVSQSCVRDYLKGKVSPLSVKTGTMAKIAKLYGVSIDALLFYLVNGRWKRGLSYQELDATLRGITNLKLLVMLQCLTSDLIREKLEELQIPDTELLASNNTNNRLIERIEEEKEQINNDQKWFALLQAFDITEGEIASLYTGQKPAFELMLRLSKLLRCEINELQTLLKEGGIEANSSESTKDVDSELDITELA